QPDPPQTARAGREGPSTSLRPHAESERPHSATAAPIDGSSLSCCERFACPHCCSPLPLRWGSCSCDRYRDVRPTSCESTTEPTTEPTKLGISMRRGTIGTTGFTCIGDTIRSATGSSPTRGTSSAFGTAGAARRRGRASTAPASSASSTATSASRCPTPATATSCAGDGFRGGGSSQATSSSSTARATSASTPAAAASSKRRTAEPQSESPRCAAGPAPGTAARAAWTSASPPGVLLYVFGHGREQLPGDRRVALDERPEVPRSHAVAEHVRSRGQRGSARRVVDERDLAEVVAGTDGGLLLAADAHVRLALLDHEEGGASRALLRHSVAGLEAALTHAARDLLEFLLVDPGDDRDVLQRVGGCAHARSYIRRRFS